MSKVNKSYVRKGRKYKPEEVFDKVPLVKGKRKERVDFDGDLIKITSDRLFVFRDNLCCVMCGIKGSFFIKERCQEHKAYHFNLYAEVNGEEILMTKDHIVPRSKGGPDRVSNYQTMCTICNGEKKDTLVT